MFLQLWKKSINLTHKITHSMKFSELGLFRASVVSSVAFILTLFLPNLSFFWENCFVIVAFPGYIHLYFWYFLTSKKNPKNVAPSS